MKKVYLLLTLLACFFTRTGTAQIGLAYDDTLICRGATITMSASFTGLVGNIALDDIYDNQPADIGFPFVFYGQTFTQCLISANGYITFDVAGKIGQHSPYTWSSAVTGGHANNIVAPGFQDLWPPQGGSIKYQSFGTPGNRRFVVEWCNMPKYGSSCVQYRVTMQLILYETTNIIEFHVKSLPGSPGCPSASPNEAIQGIRTTNGGLNEMYTPGRGPGMNWGAVGTANDAVRYTPIAAAPFYVLDTTIPFNPWLIIENVNSSQLKWYDANNNFLGQSASITVTVNDPPSPAPSTYFVVEYTGKAGCDTSQTYSFFDTVNVRFSDIKTYHTASMCAGSTYDFFGRTLFAPGTYDTVFKTIIGCDSTYVLTLNLDPLPDATTNSGSVVRICQGATHTFSVGQVAGYTYQWTRDGIAIAGANSTTYDANQPGTYRVEVTSDKGCKQISSPTNLIIAPNPTVRINYVSEEAICAEDTITLHASAQGENIEYVWFPEEYFFRPPGNSKLDEVKAIVPKSGYVGVKVINQDLCTATDSIYISAEPCCELFMPNAFTPNNDGKNDFFLPKLQVGQKVILFQVYNRYGQLLYESTHNDTKGWDGRDMNGNEVAGGVYMYALKYSCSDGQNYDTSGDVTLMR